jgi:myogenesis-regulating glycosidase
MTKTIRNPFLVPLLLLFVAVFPANASINIVDRPDHLILERGDYKLTIAREGFEVSVIREGQVVFQSTEKSDPIPNLGFFVKGEWQHVKNLRSYHESGGVLWLDYDTTVTDVTARAEIRPEEGRIHFQVWLLGSDVVYPPSLRFRLSPGAWYGGGFQGYRDKQTLPLNAARITERLFLAQGASQGTPVWYSTRGAAVWVRTPHDFLYSVQSPTNSNDASILSISMPGVSALAYDILVAPTVRDVVRVINREIGFARTVPPAEYFRLPIYTTWVEYKTSVTQQKVLEFARTIRKNELPAGVIEIDDKWGDGYGDLRFDTGKFPDPKAMIDELHRLGLWVTLWIHPFVNIGTHSFDDPAVRKFLLKDLSGDPGIIHWWQGDGAVWDFTNPAAALEFRRRLEELQKKYGFDGFKFDGGDTNLVPADLVPFRPVSATQFPDVYNREAAAHFPWSEARVGIYSQPLGIVQRLIDKNSVWGTDNGLASVVPEAIQTSMRGFVYVMPDMVGGNQYDGDRIDKELLIRWAQASALMPMMQFSLGPWHFDEETVRLCREAINLHVQFSSQIQKLAAAVPKTGEPILRPIWYNFPGDNDAEKITDEFMLGESILVAPVTQSNARSRDIYLPEGNWRSLQTRQLMTGGRLLRNYPAPLDTLPIFVREGGLRQTKLNPIPNATASN